MDQGYRRREYISNREKVKPVKKRICTNRPRASQIRATMHEPRSKRERKHIEIDLDQDPGVCPIILFSLSLATLIFIYLIYLTTLEPDTFKFS